MAKILIAEDETVMQDIIADYMRRGGHTCFTAGDGEDALMLLKTNPMDLMILDVMMPRLDGIRATMKIREESRVPIIFLSAKSEDVDKILGLNIGADDYMAKPFAFQELLARVRVMTRKKANVRENIYRCGALTMDLNCHTVEREGKQIDLSPKEFSVLLFLIRNQNIVVTREQIEANIWDLDHDSYSNVIDVYIRYLRKKIDDPYEVKLIQTIRGVGYVLRAGE